MTCYVVKYPANVSGGYRYYHTYKERRFARLAARRLIDRLNHEHCLIITIHDGSIIRREVFL